jgi:hypothetical protein
LIRPSVFNMITLFFKNNYPYVWIRFLLAFAADQHRHSQHRRICLFCLYFDS